MRLVPISGKRLCKLLETIGFERILGRGSHIRLKHPDGRRTVVPIHSGEKIGVSLLREILRQVKLTREDFERLKRKV